MAMAMAMATEDRLSSLHDYLLLEIIDRLPLRDGVATLILSNRYKNIFFRITKMKIDLSEDIWVSSDEQKLRSFLKFLAGFLPVGLNLKHMEVFCTGDLPWLCKIADFVRSCMAFSLRDNITHISFAICDRIQIPTKVFTLQNLKSLNIHSYIFLQDNVVLSLPMVEDLSFTNIVFQSESLIGRLTDACPSLRFLSLHTDFGVMIDSLDRDDRLKKRSYNVKIVHGNLETIELAICEIQGSSRICNFFLEAPKLQCATLFADVTLMGGRIRFFGEIPCIKLDGSLLNQPRERYGDAVIAFTKSLEVVNMLKAKKLIMPASAFEIVRSFKDINLLSLTCLEVAVTPHRLHMLFDLMRYTGELVCLIIHLEQETDNQRLQRARSWCVIDTLDKLIKCRVTGYNGERKMLELLECLILKARALELLEVGVCGPVVPQIKDFQNHLSKCPRGSKRCLIRVIHH